VAGVSQKCHVTKLSQSVAKVSRNVTKCKCQVGVSGCHSPVNMLTLRHILATLGGDSLVKYVAGKVETRAGKRKAEAAATEAAEEARTMEMGA
ncbi:hypothetical protein OAO87_03880, partial [bacterium]|nr:hypothetical protein [bacterium]